MDKYGNGSLFRLLHANFVHIFVNLFSQIIIGSMIEKAIGSFPGEVYFQVLWPTPRFPFLECWVPILGI